MKMKALVTIIFSLLCLSLFGQRINPDQIRKVTGNGKQKILLSDGTTGVFDYESDGVIMPYNTQAAAEGQYDVNALVTYGGYIYRSTAANNVTTPGVGTWELMPGTTTAGETRLVQDSILVYYRAGVEVDRDTIPVGLGGGGSGGVTGPGSSTDNAIARFNGTGGSVVQNSSATIDDSGNLSVSGNITVTGTVDGRDIATDGTKLDGVESGATADQTAPEIRDALATLSGVNRLDADYIKNDTVSRMVNDSILGYFVDGAEVGRDTIPVGNGGGGGGAVSSVNSQTGAVVLDADDIDDTSTTNKFATAAELSKLGNVAAYATRERHRFYFAGLGQSNMDGRDPGGDLTPNNRILLGNPNGTTSVWSPSDNNPLFQFGKQWILHNPEDTVVLFHIATGGTSISEWYPATGGLRLELDTTLANHGDPKLDGIIWHQGESDGDFLGINSAAAGQEADNNYYTAFYDSVYYQLVEQPYFDRSTPFIVGLVHNGVGYAQEGETRNNALIDIGTDSIPYTLYIDSDNLEVFEQYHFTGEAVDTMGRLYYEAFQAAPYYVPSRPIPDSLSVIVDEFYGQYYYQYQVDQGASNGADLSGDLGIAWNALPVVSTQAGHKYLQLTATTNDSFLIATSTKTLELATTRAISFDDVAIRFKLYPTGSVRSGVVFNLHGGTTSGGYAFLVQRRSDTGVEIFRINAGTATSKRILAGGNIFEASVEQEYIAEMRGDSLIMLYKLDPDGTRNLKLSYTIPLADRYTGERGVGLYTNSGTTSYFDNVRVYNANEDPDNLVGAGPLTLIATNAGDIEFTEVGVNAIRADIVSIPNSVAWKPGGNTLGAAGTIGTIGSNSFSIITNNTTRGTFPATGGFSVGSGSFTAATGIINATTGFRVNDAATSGSYLRGNGTNIVLSTIQESDLPARPATDITHTDAGGYFSGSDSETIAQEIGASLDIRETGQVLGPADASTINVTKYTTFVLIDDLVGATQTHALNPSSAPQGARVIIKTQEGLATATFSTSSGNFILSGSETGTSSYVAGPGVQAEFILISTTWFQLY